MKIKVSESNFQVLESWNTLCYTFTLKIFIGDQSLFLMVTILFLLMQGYSKVPSIDENKSGLPLTQVPHPKISRASSSWLFY